MSTASFQARGPKKHLKRLNAPKAWMLDKLGGVYAPRPSTGPHKLRESLPLVIFLRNRLKYALTKAEVTKIVMQRLIKVDGKVRTDPTFPTGFMGKNLPNLRPECFWNDESTFILLSPSECNDELIIYTDRNQNLNVILAF